MTDSIDSDAMRQKQSNQTMLPFAGGDLDRSGIRLTRAEFARFLGVSKQTVTDWVKSGKVVLGADGRLDPRQAVSQLLRSSDPARLRAKVLEPLARDVGIMQKKITDLERDLSAATEDASFHEECAGEMAKQLNTFDKRLREERDELVTLPTDKVIDSITAWWKQVSEYGTAAAGELTIMECAHGCMNEPDNLPSGATINTENGGRGE